jgi:hypothetical protein
MHVVLFYKNVITRSDYVEDHQASGVIVFDEDGNIVQQILDNEDEYLSAALVGKSGMRLVTFGNDPVDLDQVIELVLSGHSAIHEHLKRCMSDEW